MKSELIILTFLLTGLYDILLRVMSENYDKLPKLLQISFIKNLQGYFKKHTLLAAALIAGFVGAIAQLIILNIYPIPESFVWVKVLLFLVLTFLVSALLGFPIRWSKLFPYLDQYYYKPMGVWRGMYHDGISGLVVQITVLIIFLIYKKVYIK